MGAFEAQLKELRPTSERRTKNLPLTHITDWAGFLAISSAGEFAPKKTCPIYGTHLVYAFYGRPAYRLKDDGLSHNIPSFAPVCILLRSKLTDDAARLLPFDSGGFSMYGPAMHSSLQLQDYELSGGSKSPNEIIKRLWNSNLKYYGTKVLQGISIDASKIALQHYYQLISNKLSVSFDNRCSTIEVQFHAPMKLKGNVEAIIVPSEVASKHVAQIARSLKAELLTYDFEMPYNVNDFHVPLRNLVRQYLQSRQLL